MERDFLASAFAYHPVGESPYNLEVMRKIDELFLECPFNTDQGSQFTSREFTKAISDSGARISMGGRGRWLDNVMIERLWRSLKYECVYLREDETVSPLRGSLKWWFDLYNYRRPHSSLDGKKPMVEYQKGLKPEGVPPLAWSKKAA